MAIYQSRGRDPLLDSETQAALEKRSKELLGFALSAIGVLIAMMVYSYSPNDPSWISATDAPVQNWLGRFGASTIAPVMMIVGKGIWVLPVVLIAWGIRFVGHFGEERAIGRIVYTPMALALASLYAATLTPGVAWLPNFGLGGMLGDTVLGVVLNLLAPIIGSTFAVKLLSLVLGGCTLFLLAFALGLVRRIPSPPAVKNAQPRKSPSLMNGPNSKRPSG